MQENYNEIIKECVTMCDYKESLNLHDTTVGLKKVVPFRYK